MSSKSKTRYVCRECGHANTKWLGRCPACDAWSSFDEESVIPESKHTRLDRDLAAELTTVQEWVALEDASESAQRVPRYTTGISELDRVLGGGVVPDSFVLIGGDPGIGKSTLLLQAAQGLITHQPQLKVLYVSGEESIEQIRSRAERLGVKSKNQIYLAAETQLERVFATIKELRPQVLIMDSIQTFSIGALDSAPGSVSQIREVTGRLMALAKTASLNIWLVGHVTKDGAIAGPKTVEHMVDAVLYFEAESGQSFRLLRTVKNRFGSSHELGVFEMESEGLQEVKNPSALFLGERKDAVSGTAVSASIEGSRPLLMELQALVAPSGLAVPRRTSVGLDTNRLSLIAAILERHLGLQLAQKDLFFNVAGGLRLSEPACDLGVAAAIWSSHKGVPMARDTVFIGELGLTGEVRKVSQPEIRIEEAQNLGFKRAVVPTSVLSRLERFKSRISKIEIVSLSSISDLEKVSR